MVLIADNVKLVHHCSELLPSCLEEGFCNDRGHAAFKELARIGAFLKVSFIELKVLDVLEKSCHYFNIFIPDKFRCSGFGAQCPKYMIPTTTTSKSLWYRTFKLYQNQTSNNFK
jgi:hypothetical protein